MEKIFFQKQVTDEERKIAETMVFEDIDRHKNYKLEMIGDEENEDYD